MRPARFSDIPALAGLIEEMHRRSVYAEMAHLDMKAAKALLLGALKRQGVTGPGGSQALVAEADGIVIGFIIGVLVPLYDVGVELMATDLFFYVSPAGTATDAGDLLDGVIAWAEANPRVAVARFGHTDAIRQDWQRVGKLYERRGFRLSGAIYEKIIDRQSNRPPSPNFGPSPRRSGFGRAGG